MKTHRHLRLALLPLLALLLLAPSAQAQERHDLQFELESITVEPAGGDAEILVRRHCPLRANQTVTPDILLNARAEMLGTGLFDELDIYTARGSRPGTIRAVVTARPSRRFLLDTGVRYDPLRSWYLNAGLRRTGLFHRGGWARVGAQGGSRTSGFWGELSIPGAAPAGPELRLDLATSLEPWPVYANGLFYRQTIQRDRARIGLRQHIGSGMEALLWLGVSSAHPSSTLKSDGEDPDLPATALLPAAKRVNFLDLQVGLHRDRRDRLRHWQKGHWAGFTLRLAEPDRGSFAWNAELDARRFVPVLRTRAAAFRIRTAYAAPGSPYFRRFVIGGSGSLRGFQAGSLSGPRGTRALWQASAEWRQPLMGDDPRRPWVTGTLFLDVGDHLRSTGRWHGASADAGFGALLRIPWIQTLNVEVAYPLKVEPNVEPVAVQISLGRSF
jgi:outer membrane protein assembly factor BamA